VVSERDYEKISRGMSPTPDNTHNEPCKGYLGLPLRLSPPEMGCWDWTDCGFIHDKPTVCRMRTDQEFGLVSACRAFD
jgi:hypothetical protein